MRINEVETQSTYSPHVVGMNSRRSSANDQRRGRFRCDQDKQKGTPNEYKIRPHALHSYVFEAIQITVKPQHTQQPSLLYTLSRIYSSTSSTILQFSR
jgi:hypothetical protein